MNDLLVLASGSPRRRKLLDQVEIAYRTLAADIDETPGPGEEARSYVQRMAREKAQAVFSLEDGTAAVLAADTIVVLDGELLGKPRDEADAAGIIGRLSGRTHQVLSAVALLTPDGQSSAALNESQVSFAPLDEAWIRAYCATGEPLDKAGAYGIQGLAATRIERLEGSFSCVMGLPLFETAELLRAAGWELLPGARSK